VGRGLAIHGHYAYTDSANTDVPPFNGKKVPFLARHQADAGATWTPRPHMRLALVAIHRSPRFSDELNRSPLAASWDGYASAFVETSDKRWSVEVQATNLWNREVPEGYGIILSYRF